MKQLLIGVFLFLPAIAMADDTTVTGTVTEINGEFQIQDDANGQVYSVGFIPQGGSIDAQVHRFRDQMSEAVGHEAQLTGEFTALTTGDQEFDIDLNASVTVLPN